MKTMAFKLVGRVVVWVGAEATPTDAEWDEYLETIRAAAGRRNDLAFFVWSGAGSPSTVQRRRLIDAMEGAKFAAVFVLESLVARGAVTAISWFFPQIKTFGPTEVDRAFQALALRPDEAREVEQVTRELRTELLRERSTAR